MTEKEVIDLLVQQKREENVVFSEYQKNTRIAVLVSIIAIAVISLGFSISFSCTVSNIAEEQQKIVEHYFYSDYEYGTITQEMSIGGDIDARSETSEESSK